MGFIFKKRAMLGLLGFFLGLTQVAYSASDIQLVVSIKPLHSLASALMRGVAEPQLLIKGRASPHHFSLKPSHIRLLQQADLLLWLGGSVESSLAKVVGQLPSSVQSLSLLQEPSVLRLSLRNGGVWQHDHHEGVAQLLDEDLKIDPHLWLDPLNAKRIVRRLLVALSLHDPEHQAEYQANADRLLEHLDVLHGRIKQRLKAVQNVPYLVYHDAYQYLEKRYSLAAQGAFVLDVSHRPGAKRMRSLRNKIKTEIIRCAFLEPQYDARLLNSVVADLPIKVKVLDPLGADLLAGEALYFDLMEALTVRLASCLSD